VRTLRVTVLLAALLVLSACGREPSASQLTATGIANLQSAKTAHLDGTGAIALKAQSGLSFSFEFKLSGDAEIPSKARMNIQMALLGMSFNVDTITVDGKQYTKDAVTGLWAEGSKSSSMNGVLDPLGNVDMSFIHDVVEVDRPEVDGRKTRHLRYQADTTKMIAALQQTAGTSTQPLANPVGTGELWIRIDDSQIVRQLVKVSLDVDGLAGISLPGSTSNIGKASVEMSLDMRFSRHGEAVPQITAPPTGR
jgi:FlaG/FlaF family flagellin (archaellin)